VFVPASRAVAEGFDDEGFSREILRQAYEVAGVGVYRIDLDRQMIQLSAEMAHLLRAGDRAIEMPLAEYRRRFHHPDDRDATIAKAERAYAQGDQVDLDARVVRGDGEVIWVRASSTTHTSARGERSVIGVLQDVTERHRSAQSLAANEALLRQFIEHTPAAVAMFDREMRYLHVSDRWITDYRLEGREVIGRSHYEVFPDIPDRWKAVHQRALAGARESCAEDPFPRADGGHEWLEWDVQPWRDAAGAIGGIIMFTQVITRRKNEEERHRKAEQLFRALTENSLVGVFVRTADRITYVNPAIERMFGYEPGEMVGKSPMIVHAGGAAGTYAADVMARRVRGELDDVRIDVRGTRKDGTTLQMDVFGFATDIDGEPSVIGNIVDITERREIEDRFRALSENSQVCTSRRTERSST
jgi:PAS domain S-box-containing protein